MIDEDRVAALVTAGASVVVADGVGAPYAALGPLSRVAAAAGDVRLLLGWLPQVPADLDVTAFADVRTVMAGYGLRELVDTAAVRYVPTRLAAVPALLHDVVRPSVLVASVVRGSEGRWFLPTESSWMPAAVDAGP